MTTAFLTSKTSRYCFAKLFSNINVELIDNPDNADLLLFPGGMDINPKLYKQEKHKTTWFDEIRDSNEIAIFNKYKDKKKVGICRGAQLGHVLSGGFLIQDVNHHQGKHRVQFGKENLVVSSTHHQMMGNPIIGDILAITTLATKKEIQHKETKDIQSLLPYDIEVMYHAKTNFLSIQSHPEFPNYPENTKMFYTLLKKIFNIG